MRLWLLAAAISLVIHGISFVVVSERPEIVKKQKLVTKVKIRVAEKKKEPPPEVKPPPKPKPTPKPKKKAKKKPKPKKKKVASVRKPPKNVKTTQKPVFGMDKPLNKTGKGVAVPVGNTLMMEDDKKRVKDVAPLAVDLSSDAKLVRSTIVTPEYTEDALDADFEGYVVVDVYVDRSGKVVEAELQKKIGYGMGPPIIAAAKKARFTPRKNRLGKPMASWTTLKFNLQIP